MRRKNSPEFDQFRKRCIKTTRNYLLLHKQGQRSHDTISLKNAHTGSFWAISSRSVTSRASRREIAAAAAACSSSPSRKSMDEPIFVSDGQTIRSDPHFTLSLKKNRKKDALSLLQVNQHFF